MENENNKFMQEAIKLSVNNVEEGKGGPFGAVVVKDGKIIARGVNEVTASNDPTAHAEVVAIRNACIALNTFQLDGCEIYTSCEPCPMCLGAIYWARPQKVVYANTRKEAAAIEFDDEFIYREINAPMNDRKIPFIHHPHPQAEAVFEEWKKWEGKIKY